MALFRSDKRSTVTRLKKLDWKGPEHRDELLQSLLTYELVLSDISWMLASRDRSLRVFALHNIREQKYPNVAGELIDLALATQDGSRHALLQVIVETADTSAFNRLSDLLRSDQVRERDLAVDIVLTFPFETVKEHIYRLMRHANREIRLRALKKVTDVGPKTPDAMLRRHLIALSQDPEERIRILAVQAISGDPDDELLDILCERLRSDTFAVRRVAAQGLDTLAEAHDARIIEKLVPMLSQDDHRVRDAVFRILFKVGEPTELIRRVILYSKTLMGWMRERIHHTIRSFGEQVLDPVLQLMDHPDEDIRNAALIFATHFSSQRLIEPLIRLTTDTNWWTRVIALETLAQYQDERVVDVLIGCLNDEEVRWSAVEALAKVGSPRALGPIARLLRDSVTDVRREVIRALDAYNDPRALPLLEQCFKADPDLAVREQALAAYRKISKRNKIVIDEAALLDKMHAGRGGRTPLENLLIETRRAGGSDLHVFPDTRPIVRCHGRLQPLTAHPAALSTEQVREMLAEILDDKQRQRFKLERQLDFCHDVPDVGRCRVNIYQEMRGVGAVFRIIPNEIPEFEYTGLPTFVMDIANYSQGLILVSGAAGTGKTTTLAALINLYNERRRGHIITIEDPIEFVHPYRNCLVNQRGLGTDTQSFPVALRAALREDPDVVVIGEMRDIETCRLAVDAAETGHVVIGTIQTSSALKALRRLIDMFPAAEQSQVRNSVAEVLKLVICQTLVPAREGGRIPCHEILVMTRAIAHAVREERDLLIPSLMQMARSVGTQSMDEALMQLYRAGRVTAEDAYLRAEKREDFEGLVNEAFLKQVFE